MVHMMLGEVSPGRRRRRPDGHADLRPARGVHRRPDGRANAGVPRQEDPGPRDEARRAVPHRDAARRCSGSPPPRSCSTRRPRRSSTPAARPVGGALQLRLGGQQQRLGLRRPGHRHRLVHGDPGHRDADRPLLPDHPGAGHRRLARAQAAGPGHRRHVPDRLARCSVASSPGRSSSSPASRSSPPSPSARSSSTCRRERRPQASMATAHRLAAPTPVSTLATSARPRCAAGRRAPARCSTRPSSSAPRSTRSSSSTRGRWPRTR